MHQPKKKLRDALSTASSVTRLNKNFPYWVCLLLITVALPAFSACSEPFIPDTPDESALLAIYNATVGEEWDKDSKWLTNTPLGKWYGVTVDSNGRVTELRLGDNGLDGVIPPEVGNLEELEHLDLGTNHGLIGGIPPELGKLARLKHLDLGYIGLYGRIPPELSDLASLEHLNLSGNNLSEGIPPELGNLSGLRHLDLSRNNLLTSTRMGGVPSTNPALDGGSYTGSNDPRTRTIPPELGNLSMLEHLNLRDSSLTGTIPPTLGNLAQLEHLDLGENSLSGRIPPTLGNLSNLKYLRVGTTTVYVMGFPQSGAKNKFVGCIPQSLWSVESHDLGFTKLLPCDPFNSTLGEN